MARLTADGFSAFAIFESMDEAALSAIAQACSARDLAPGELVIGHKDTSFDVFFLFSGKLHVNLYSADGQKVGFHELGPGAMFGEISAVDGQPRSASVEAASGARIAVMPRQRFLAMIGENPRFAMALARQLAGQVRRLTTRVFEFSTMAVRQRLRAELLRLARDSACGASIALLPTHAELASRISTHREAVSREMAWLEAQGLVAKAGRSLTIPDLARFRALLEENWEA